MHTDPLQRQTFIRVTVVGWDKWKKRVTRRQRRYTIRIIKSQLTRREGEESRVDASLRITLHITLRRERNVVAILRKLISHY